MRSFTSYFFQSIRLTKIGVVVSSSWQHLPDEPDEWQIDELARTEHGESFFNTLHFEQPSWYFIALITRDFVSSPCRDLLGYVPASSLRHWNLNKFHKFSKRLFFISRRSRLSRTWSRSSQAFFSPSGKIQPKNSDCRRPYVMSLAQRTEIIGGPV